MSSSNVPDPSRAARPPRTARTGRRLGGVLVGLALVLVVAALSVAIGNKHLSLDVIVQALSGDPDAADGSVIWERRIPRTLAGLIAGTALGVAGALIQAFTRNPLADPGILGVNAGAACAIAVGILVTGVASTGQYVWFAFGGALLATLAVYAIGVRGAGSTTAARMTLAGVALGAVLTGVTTALLLANPDAFDRVRSWNAGSLATTSFTDSAAVVPFFAVGLLLSAACASPLNSIALGEQVAASQGVAVGRVRLFVVVAVALLASSATAIAGPITFIGLMAPHIARWIVGPDHRWIVGLTLVIAPVILLLSDVLGRIALSTGEVPVGVVSGVVGAPLLIALARRRKATGL